MAARNRLCQPSLWGDKAFPERRGIRAEIPDEKGGGVLSRQHRRRGGSGVEVGSLSELETQLMIADKLGYIEAPELLDEVETLRRKMLNLTST